MPTGDCPRVDVHVHYHGPDHAAQLNRMEIMMATETEQITALSAKVDDLVADVRAALDALEAERDNLGDEGQAALDALTAKIDAFDAEVGDADGSDTPAEPTPEG